MAEFLTAQVAIRADIARLKVDLEAARREVYRTVDALSLKAAGSDVDKLAKRAALITQRGIKDQIRAENELLRGLREREVQNNKIAREHKRAVNEMIEDLKRFSTVSVATGTSVLVGLGYSIKQYANVNKAMREALATSDIHPSEIDFSQISQGAEEAAIRFNVSIQEISKALNVLKVSGLDVATQLKVLPTVIALAKGSMTDVGIVSDKIFDVMGAFDLGLDQLTNVSNGLAFAATHSRTTLSDLLDGLMAVGTVSEMTGNTFEELTASIMFMADAGIKGSQAGMALRRTFFNLMNEQSKATKSLQEYVNIYDPLTNQMKPFVQILDELVIALQNVDEKTRDTVLSHLFEQRAVTGGLAVFRAGSKGLLEYSDRIRNAGDATQNLANYQLKALSEQLGILWQQVSAIIRRIGQGLEPAITSLNNTLRPTLNALRAWMDLNPQIVQSISTVAATASLAAVSIGGLGIGIRTMSVFVAPLISTVRVLGATVLSATAPFLLWVAAIASVAAAFYVMRAAWNSNTGAITDRLRWLADSFKSTCSWLSDTFTALWTWLKDSASSSIDYLANTTFGKFFSWLYTEFMGLAKNLWNGWSEFIGNLVGLVQGAVASIAQLGKGVQGFFDPDLSWTDAFTRMKSSVAAMPDAFSSAFTTAAEETKTKLDSMSEYAVQKLSSAADAIADGTVTALDTAGVYIGAYVEATGDNINQLMEATKVQFKTDLDSMIKMLSSQFPEFTALLSKYQNAVTENLPDSVPTPSRQIDTAPKKLDNIQIGINKYYDSIRDINTFIQDSFVKTASSIEGAMADAFSSIVSDGKSLTDALKDFLSSVTDAIVRMYAEILARQVMMSSLGFMPGLAGYNNRPAGDVAPASTTVAVAHSGGIVGSSNFSTRAVSPSLFDAAPRLHQGLATDEFPAILQRGEQVIPKNKSAQSDTNVSVAAPQIIINNNTGQPVKQDGQPQFNGKEWVVSVVIDNIQRGGALATAIKGAR